MGRRIERFSSKLGTAGNLFTGIHLAALALTHNAVLVSFDNDFGRFTGLRRENPERIGFARSH